MIQTVLSFLLGFLVATALALAVAPALWRRAGALMRKRIEASMPLTRDELQAEIDAVNAEHAMAIRRLEMKAEAIKKKAAQDLVEINRLREEVTDLREQCTERDAAILKLEAERQDLAEQFAEREAEAKALSPRLAQLENDLEERSGEVAELSRLYEESILTASSRQIDLVAREADVERLTDTVTLLHNQRKEADRAVREAVAEKVQLEEALRLERKRSAELERKLERMMTNISTRDERLERQANEIARLKQKIRDGSAGSREPALLAELEKENARLEMQVAASSLELSLPISGEGAEAGPEAEAQANSEVERLQLRLSALIRENKKLRAQLAAGSEEDTEKGEEMLRESISSLTAEVVRMAAALEGPDSPIEKALAEAPAAAGGTDERRPSLADRVRALMEGAPAK